MELTDQHGNIAWAGQYKAWGEVRQERSDWAKQVGMSNPIRFQGQYHDHETGLHYNRHRYYDPRTGRFISKDPISYMGGLNLFTYAFNAIQWIDPKGLSKKSSSRNYSSAEEAADAALASGRVSGAAAELRINGRVYTGVSSEVVDHSPVVTGVLMGTPLEKQAPWHGGCAEIVCLDKALVDGVDPAGGKIRAVNIGRSGKGHGTSKPACKSCRDAMRNLEVEWE